MTFSVRTAAALALSAVLVSVVSPVVLAASLSSDDHVALFEDSSDISTIARRHNNNGGGGKNNYCMWQGQSYQQGVSLYVLCDDVGQDYA